MPTDHDPDRENDAGLFREAVGEVRRIRSGRDDSRPPAPEPEPLQRRRDEARVMEELAEPGGDFAEVETGEELLWLQEGLQRRVLTRLRRGHWRVQDELDLHQMNVETASGAIRDFLDRAEGLRLTCVKIIHGKGLRSGPDGPRLKRLTARLLSRRRRVRAFASAPAHDGGTGAVLVLLAARR